MKNSWLYVCIYVYEETRLPFEGVQDAAKIGNSKEVPSRNKVQKLWEPKEQSHKLATHV